MNEQSPGPRHSCVCPFIHTTNFVVDGGAVTIMQAAIVTVLKELIFQRQKTRAKQVSKTISDSGMCYKETEEVM